MERRHFVLHDVPHDLRIETEVLMNQNISKTSYFLPFHCGVLRTKILGDLLDGLTNDFKVSDDRVNRFSSSRNAALERPAVYTVIFRVASRISSR